MQARRAVVSLVVGGIVALVVAGFVGIPQLVGPANIGSFIANSFTFWGLLFGAFAGVATAGVTFAILNRADRKTSRWGRLAAGITLALLAAGTWWWIVMWRASLFTLEGLWMYPLALAATLSSFILVRRRRPDAWEEPPGS